MNVNLVADALRRLLAAEETGLIGRLLESTVFVGLAEAEDLDQVRRMARENVEHQRWLTEALFHVRSAPGPRKVDVTSADLHYQDLEYALPRIIAREQELAERFRAGLNGLADAPAERELFSRIAQRHEAHARALWLLMRRRAPQPATPS